MQTGRRNQTTHSNDKVQDGLEAWQVLWLDMRCPHSQPGAIPKEREEKTPKPHWQWKCEFTRKHAPKTLHSSYYPWLSLPIFSWGEWLAELQMQLFSSIPARQARSNELRRYQRWQQLLVQLLLIDKRMAREGVSCTLAAFVFCVYSSALHIIRLSIRLSSTMYLWVCQLLLYLWLIK